MENKIAAVVVTYNRKQLLVECIEALLDQSCSDGFDILVIDNASTDGTVEDIASLVKTGKVKYHNTGANLGGAGGFNFGIKLAVEAGYEYLWIMDDDCIPESAALDELLSAARSLGPDWGFLASRVLWVDGSNCVMNEVKLDKRGRAANLACPLCRQASFVSLFLNSSVVKQIGLPIKDFFIWGDDVEYTRRLSTSHHSYYVPESVVVHKTANNTGSDISRDAEERIDRYRYAYRNEVYIARHEGPGRKAYQVAKVLYHMGRVALRAPSQKKRRMQTILRSTVEGLSFDPAVEFPDCKVS